MKKLITIMAAAASALFAFGGVVVTLPSGTSVEAYTGALQTDKNDAGTETSSRYWFLDGDAQAELLVTNYEGGVTLPTRPVQFAEQTNDNYLKIETSGRLYRSIGVNSQTVDSFPTVDISDGIYLDTLVQFTPAEDAFGAEAISAGDKIAIEYVENEGYTNFVVRAAYVDAANSAIVATNYFLTLPGQAANEVQFDKTAWHRLTVRAISNVGNDFAPVGFVVYVDGTNLVYDVNVAAGDQAYEGSLNSVVQTYIYNGEKHALLPSLMTTEDVGYNTLAAVAFNGNGCVDDISFTATQPTFIVEGTAVTIAWDANVATYTVVAGETKLIDGEAVSGAGSTNLLLDTSVATLTVTATYATGYEAGTWTVTGSGAEISGSTFTVAPGAELNIVSMLPLFQVGETNYGTFGAALAAAVAAGTEQSPATIKLLANYGEGVSFANGYIVLDLNGKTLQGTVEEFTINNSGAVLTIIDSASGGTVIAPSGEASRGALYMDDGSTVISGGRFEGYVITQKMDEDEGADDLTLNGGVFFDDLYNPEAVDSKFYLYDYLGTDVKATYNAGYFTVGGEEPEPVIPTCVLTIPEVSGASAEVTSNDVVVADLTAIPSNTAVVVTWTLSEGYKLTDGSLTENITMDSNKTAATPTVAKIQYVTLTITPVANCTIVVSNATDEVATGTKFDKDDEVKLTVYRTPAEGYELDGCAASETITMDQDQTVTAAVKSSGGSGWEPDPSKIDPSATAADTYPELDGTALATANAQKLTAWAAAKSIDFAAVTGGAATYVDAFLLNCAPDEVEAANADFKATITVNADGTVTVTAPGDYNVTPTIQGKASLSDSEWHAKTDGDQFFRAILSL